MSARAAVLSVLVVAVAGCGGGAPKEIAVFGGAPWDRAVSPSEDPDIPAEWARGEVVAVSEDGGQVSLKVHKGLVRTGERVGIFWLPTENPSPRYLADEVKELRAATATVISVRGEVCEAQIMEGTLRAPIYVGDRIMVRTP